MNALAVTLQGISFDCDKCDKSFTSLAYVKQHQQGKHKGGFITLCGVVYP